MMKSESKGAGLNLFFKINGEHEPLRVIVFFETRHETANNQSEQADGHQIDYESFPTVSTRRSTARPTALVADLLTGDLNVIEVSKAC